MRSRHIIALSGLVPAGVASTVSAIGVSNGSITEQPDREVTREAIAASENRTPATAPVPVAFPEHPSVTKATTGQLPHIEHPHPVAASPPPATAQPPRPAFISSGPLGIPSAALAAYQKAEQTLAVEKPGCGMSWELLAGIGRVESHHASNGRVDAHGTANPPIYGPALDGSLPGNEVIGDGAGGYQRAQGPMQFMPGTWQMYAKPGMNPQNLFDATLTAGRYLCAGNLDMRDLRQRTRAILRYNNSMAYVAHVMAWSLGYSTGAIPTATALPRI